MKKGIKVIKYFFIEENYISYSHVTLSVIDRGARKECTCKPSFKPSINHDSFYRSIRSRIALIQIYFR